MTFKEKVETLQALVTITAVVIGGVWTYNLFVKERQHYPHATIEQKLSHVALSEQTNLLRVGIDVTNTGSSRLILGKSIIRIQRILPLLSCPKEGPCAAKEVNDALQGIERNADRFSWPLIAERDTKFTQPLDIEPGEKDFIEFEFAVPSEVAVVRVYSYFRNDQKSDSTNEVGWSLSSQYDFRTSKEERAQ
ncbi:hypothetical protein [Candidatus Nitrospira bockiana]